MPTNRAAELGPSKFDWWQDWRGECVAIVASGPSTKKSNVAALRDRIHVIAIKENVDLCPWADVVYGCDGPWWVHRKGLPNFKGIKLSQDATVCARLNLHRLEVEAKGDKLLTDKPGVVGSGGNSGFQALNLAVQFGVNGVILVGFDMQGDHWYGRNKWDKANNPTEDNFRRWISSLTGVAPDLKARGIDVVNTSQASLVKCFRHRSIEDTLNGWGL